MQEQFKIGTERLIEQEIQKDWGRIDKSKFSKNYKEWEKSYGMEKYWNDKRIILVEKRAFIAQKLAAITAHWPEIGHKFCLAFQW